MSDPKLPYMQFYTGDWLKDPCLSRCGPATRGIWIDLLCAIHDFNRSGRIVGTADELARICRCTAVEFVDAADELRSTSTATITVRDGRYTIINRRMKRQSKSAQKSRENAPTASGGRKRKSGGPKTYGNNKSPPIPIPKAFSNSSSPKPIGVCAENLLNLDLVVAEKRAEFCHKISEIFRPTKREAKTFANIAFYLVMKIQSGDFQPDIFDRAIDWAQKARESRGVRNKKALFVAKVKKETGFKAQEKLL